MDQYSMLLKGILAGPVLQTVATLHLSLRYRIGMAEQMILEVGIVAERGRTVRTGHAELDRLGTFLHLIAGWIVLSVVVRFQRDYFFFFLRWGTGFLRRSVQGAQIGRTAGRFLLLLLQLFQ